VPVVLAFLPVMGFYLTRKLGSHAAPVMPPVGAWSAAEKRVLTVFALTALAWITRLEPLGGWAGLLASSNHRTTWWRSWRSRPCS
jgi:sodium-dependent dicarboxylate transporter 2/3/5